jgi:DNA-binding HxlR family transcriptional regulator
VDWQLYGWACYSHWSAIIKAPDQAMQPAAIKRRARQQDPALRISANNVREVIKLLVQKGIVTKTELRGAAHPRYTLTATGRTLRRLLFSATTRIRKNEQAPNYGRELEMLARAIARKQSWEFSPRV